MNARLNAAAQDGRDMPAPANASQEPVWSFVPMQDADLAPVLALEQRLVAYPWSAGNFADSLKAGDSAWLMRSATGELLGFAVMLLAVDEVELLNIGIAPEHQRQGLGGRLLARLFDVARRHGAARMCLEVRVSNAAGRALYARHGFVQIGARPNYYPAPQGRETALVLARELG